MTTPQWREEAGGRFVAETARFNLVVRRTASAPDGSATTAITAPARFLVLMRRTSGADALVGSGTTLGIAKAMDAAEKMARKLRAAVTRERRFGDRGQRRHYSCDPAPDQDHAEVAGEIRTGR